MNELEFCGLINIQMSVLRSNAIKFTKNLDDADDLVQETLIKAFRFSHKFQKGTNFKGWLLMIMRNTFINTYHKIAKIRTVVDVVEDLSDHHNLFSSTLNVSTEEMALDDIYKAINKLPAAYRIPFVRYFEGYKYAEIAEELNIPLGTVKTHIYMARETLKKNLKRY